MIVATPIWDQGQVQKDPRLAFIIMPFRSKWSNYIYNELLKPIISEKGLTAQRADEMMGRNVLQDIWKAIYAARLVIAEITEHNANVYYELGIAHTLGKKAVLLTQNIDAVPFDLRQQRIIVYTDDLPGYRKLQAELPQHLAAILAEPVDEIHHIRSTLGGYLVEHARLRLKLRGDRLESADVVDEMKIIGTRENVVLANKVIDHVGVVSGMTCNHTFVRSTQYPDIVRIAALFDEPYVQIGTHQRITFRYGIERAFEGDNCRWNYDIAVDTTRLDFELVAPLSFQARVRLAQHVKPIDHDLQILNPTIEDDCKLYRASVAAPEVGAVYALVWY